MSCSRAVDGRKRSTSTIGTLQKRQAAVLAPSCCGGGLRPSYGSTADRRPRRLAPRPRRSSIGWAVNPTPRWARFWVASGEYLQGNLAEARRLIDAVLAKVRAGLRVEPDFHLRLVIALAAIETRDGEYDHALAYLSEIRGLADTLDDRRRAPTSSISRTATARPVTTRPRCGLVPRA
jgi:hypothetical protein